MENHKVKKQIEKDVENYGKNKGKSFGQVLHSNCKYRKHQCISRTSLIKNAKFSYQIGDAPISFQHRKNVKFVAVASS